MAQAAIPGAITLRAPFFFFVVSAAVAAAANPALDADSEAEGMAVTLMQSRTQLMSGPRHTLRNQAAQSPETPREGARASEVPTDVAFDSTVFAQTAVEVSTGKAQPSWLANEKVEEVQLDEEAMCSSEGMTPGICVIASLARSAAPSAANGNTTELAYADPERLERALFEELEAALAGRHSGFSTAHMAHTEESLRGFFDALPKNNASRLEHATVRYALHQHFLRAHAWYIRSLNPVGEAQTPASAGEALRGQVPVHLQTLIERRQGGRGLGLHELAALVATLEHLIQGDMVERLKAAYRAHGQQPGALASKSDVADVLKTYMAHFLSMEHKSGYAVTPEEARQERESIAHSYGGWQHVAGIIEEAVQKRAPESAWKFLSFSEALAAAQEVMEKYEAISNADCQDIKRDLSQMPNGASGEVLLADLHRRALEGEMLFSESSEYLATLGALSDGERGISVLVPNYVYSPSNCLGTTSFFDLCCPNECESLLEQLEAHLRKPEATPAEVLDVLSSLPGYGAVSEDALSELDILAHQRDGRVPLHGYSFASWLHHSFPRECPRPRPEDYKGARQDAEVPAAESEFQAVAKLPFIVATRSELMDELETAEAEEEAEEAEEEEQLLVNATLAANASTVFGGATASVQSLKTLAAKRLMSSGLKVAAGLDAFSLAQTASEVQEDSAAQGRTGGLNVRRLV